MVDVHRAFKRIKSLRGKSFPKIDEDIASLSSATMRKRNLLARSTSNIVRWSRSTRKIAMAMAKPSSRDASDDSVTTVESKCVHFGESLIHAVESYADFPVWWTKRELQIMRQRPKKIHQTDTNVSEYVKAFSYASFHCYRQRDLSHHGLSSTSLGGVLSGLAAGYHGLERFTPYDSARQIECRRTIRTIVMVHRFAVKHHDNMSQAQEDIRDFSRSLTERSTTWAATLGNAIRAIVLADTTYEI